MADPSSNGTSSVVSPAGSPISKPWSPTTFNPSGSSRSTDARLTENSEPSGLSESITKTDTAGVMQGYFSQKPDKALPFAQAVANWHQGTNQANNQPLDFSVADLEKGLSNNALTPAMRRAIDTFEATPQGNEWRQANLNPQEVEAYERAIQQALVTAAAPSPDAPTTDNTVNQLADPANKLTSQNDSTNLEVKDEETKTNNRLREQSAAEFDYKTADLIDKHRIVASTLINSEHGAISTSKDLDGLSDAIDASAKAPLKPNESVAADNTPGLSKLEQPELLNNIERTKDTQVSYSHAVADWSNPNVMIPDEDGSGNSKMISRDPKTGAIMNIQHLNAEGHVISPDADEQKQLKLPNQPNIEQNPLRV